MRIYFFPQALTISYPGVGLENIASQVAKSTDSRSGTDTRPSVKRMAVNELARAHGLTSAQMALAFCYTNWRVASTIIGVTSLAHLDEIVAVWGTRLAPELLAEIDKIRLELRDPAT